MIIWIWILTLLGQEKLEVTGAGSTFAYPAFALWADLWHSQTGHRLNYQSIGSGGGIRQVVNATVDFGASDAPLEPDEVNKQQLLQVPILFGAVVVVFNLPVISSQSPLKLSVSAICGIFKGQITQWDDPQITASNPGLKLPPQKIVVVHRADGSGTTWLFTRWLASQCPDWKTSVGFGTSVNWPVGIAAKGNEGVTQTLARTPGAIGYVEQKYAQTAKLPTALLENSQKRFVSASLQSIKVSAQSAKWDSQQHFFLKEYQSSNPESYPLWGGTYVLLNLKEKNRAQKAAQFIRWLLESTQAQTKAQEEGYLTPPSNLQKQILDYLKSHGL